MVAERMRRGSAVSRVRQANRRTADLGAIEDLALA
jgi:hypothetical protein